MTVSLQSRGQVCLLFSTIDKIFPSGSKVRWVGLWPTIKDLGSVSLGSSVVTSVPSDLGARVAHVKMKIVLLMSCE